MEGTDNLIGLKRVIIGIVGFAIIYLFSYLIDSGLFSKKKRRKYNFQKKEKTFIQKQKELELLKERGILTEEELNKKIDNLKEEHRKSKINFELSQNDKYEMILKSHKKGHITDREKSDKIEQLRNDIIKSF